MASPYDSEYRKKMTSRPTQVLSPPDGKIKAFLNADFYYISSYLTNHQEVFNDLYPLLNKVGTESGSRVVQIFSSYPSTSDYSGYPTLPMTSTPSLDQIRLQLNETLKASPDTTGFQPCFNICLVNLYPNGSSKIGMHSDKEEDLIPGGPIASITLGSKRHFDIWCKPSAPQMHDRYRIDLDPGSLLLMGRNSQRHYLHGIPAQLTVKEPRINLTFRMTR